MGTSGSQDAVGTGAVGTGAVGTGAAGGGATESAASPAATDPAARAQDVAARLDERYGRTRSARRVRAGRFAAVVAVTAGLGWVVWAGVGGAGASVSSTDVGFRIVGDGAVAFTYDVSMAPGRTAGCTLQALDRTNGTVGLRTVTIGPSRQQVTRTTSTIRTSAQAVNAVVRECTLRP